jgi:hypothetical protein
MSDNGIVLAAIQYRLDSQGFILTGQIPVSQFKLPDFPGSCQRKGFYLKP